MVSQTTGVQISGGFDAIHAPYAADYRGDLLPRRLFTTDIAHVLGRTGVMNQLSEEAHLVSAADPKTLPPKSTSSDAVGPMKRTTVRKTIDEGIAAIDRSLEINRLQAEIDDITIGQNLDAAVQALYEVETVS